MKIKILLSAIVLLTFSNRVQSQNSDAIASAFFGVDNALPFATNFLLCRGAFGMDGMPVNFNFPINASGLSASDFEVVDSQGNISIPICATLAPANENGENRTVLLVGEFGTAVTNPPVEVRIVGDLFTTSVISGESACSEVLNLNGLSTTNVVPLNDGPSLFFAQQIEGSVNECTVGNQTIQVAWNGGVVPFIAGDNENDLFQYYVGYSESSGVLIPHVPIAIADINDNDNFHQLCFSTTDKIVKISMMANTVEDPNQDPNLSSEIDVSYCEIVESVSVSNFNTELEIYTNPFSGELFINNASIDEPFIIYNNMGQNMMEGRYSKAIDTSTLPPGVYHLFLQSNVRPTAFRLIKK